MSLFQTLPLAERAKQLANPEGAVGLAVAEWLNETNKQGNTRAIQLLGLQENDRVLEIGFGNGHTVPEVLSQAPGVQYVGLDISPTMVEEARRFNTELVASGQASFLLGSAEQLPFPDNTFRQVFAIGVMHFWAQPAKPLAEICRVLQPGGKLLMGGVAPQSAPEYALPEYGFYLRDAAAWETLCREAGFSQVDVETPGFAYTTPDGVPATRYVIQISAQA